MTKTGNAPGINTEELLKKVEPFAKKVAKESAERVAHKVGKIKKRFEDKKRRAYND